MIAYSELCAFTSTPGHGNRAGVVLDADTLSDREMQRLAAFLEAPETVFVTRLSRHSAQVRYFTPTQEIDFCGHATLGLGLALAQSGHWQGQPFHLDTLAGPVPLRLECDAGVPTRVWMQQPALQTRPLPSSLRGELAEALGIDSRMIHRGLPLAAASTGGWSVFVPLLDRLILDGLEPDLPRIHALTEALDVISLHAYAPQGVNRFATRDFAPRVGIPEDPVTGSAAGALLGLLASLGRLPLRGGRASGLIAQGHALGTPGEVEVDIEMQGDQVRAVHVGGQAVLEREGIWTGH